MLSFQSNTQTTIKPTTPTSAQLIVKYVTICANESISYFAEHFLTALSAQKYAFRSNQHFQIKQHCSTNDFISLTSILLPILIAKIKKVIIFNFIYYKSDNN